MASELAGTTGSESTRILAATNVDLEEAVEKGSAKTCSID